MPIPFYKVDDIKYGTDDQTFERAVVLLRGEKVQQFKAELTGFFATVQGTQTYQVFVDGRHYDQGSCTCYLGEREVLCKHMVAVALRAAAHGAPLTVEASAPIGPPRCSGVQRSPTQSELTQTKNDITAALRFIKAYRGPSRHWFAYQDSLSEGCRRLSKVVSGLPVHVTTAEILVNLLLRLDKKISSAVDDSDGTVGGFIEEVVRVLQDFAKLDATCCASFSRLRGRQTMFGWEEPLLKNLHE